LRDAGWSKNHKIIIPYLNTDCPEYAANNPSLWRRKDLLLLIRITASVAKTAWFFTATAQRIQLFLVDFQLFLAE
jgi:hypothetical protein